MGMVVHLGHRGSGSPRRLGISCLGGAGRSQIAARCRAVGYRRPLAASYEWPDQIPAILGVLGLGLLVYCAFRTPIEQVLPAASTSIFCLFYVGFTLIALPALREQTNGPSLVAFLLCVVWAGDIAALYVGRTLGRHKLAPRLSPGKSWEGAVASVAGSLLAAGGLVALARWMANMDSAKLSYPEELGYWLGLAVILNIAAQLGDLAESALSVPRASRTREPCCLGTAASWTASTHCCWRHRCLWYAQVIHQRF